MKPTITVDDVVHHLEDKLLVAQHNAKVPYDRDTSIKNQFLIEHLTEIINATKRAQEPQIPTDEGVICTSVEARWKPSKKTVTYKEHPNCYNSSGDLECSNNNCIHMVCPYTPVTTPEDPFTNEITIPEILSEIKFRRDFAIGLVKQSQEKGKRNRRNQCTANALNALVEIIEARHNKGETQ